MRRALVGLVVVVAAGAAGFLVMRPKNDWLEHFHRGVALMEQHAFTRAAEEFEHAVAARPDWYAAQFNLGLAYMNTQTDTGYAKAREHLERAAQLKPDLPWAHFSLGILYKQLQLEGDRAALRAYEKAVTLDPLDARSHYEYGALLANEAEANDDPKLAAESEQHLRRATELDPYLDSAWYKLFTVLLKRSQKADGAQKLELRDQATACMTRFQELKNTKTSTPAGLKYTEMGHYAEVIHTVEPEIEPRTAAPAAVTFIDVTARTGLPAAIPSTQPAPAFIGLTVADLDADGDDDLLLPVGGSITCFLADGKGSFQRTDVGLPQSSTDVHALAGDYDRDGDLDLYVLRDGKGTFLQSQRLTWTGTDRDQKPIAGALRFTDVTEATHTGLESGLSLASAFADADHDGDLDLFVTSHGGGNHLYSNNGDGTFTDIAAVCGLELKGVPCRKALFSDLDLDHDTDLLVLVEGDRPRLFLNDRAQKYHEAPASLLPREADDGWGATSADADADGDWDLLVCRGPDRPAVLLENQDGRGTFRVDARAPLAPATTGTFLDVDNDGDLDLALGGGKEQAITLFENDGNGRLRDVSASAGLATLKGPGGVSLEALDLDQDGDLDLIAAGPAGGVTVLRNDGGSRNHWVDIALEGGDQPDASANARGVGSRVEVRAGPIYQAIETHAGCGFLSQASSRVHFGLGKQTRIDYVRCVWPDAVVQSEMEVAADGTQIVHETQRKLSSCPTLFTWDGTRFQLVTDFLGVGGLGYFAAPGVSSAPDPTEVVRIAPGQLAPRDGMLELRILEPLEEVTYLDRLELVAIDHDASVLVLPDERLGISPPLPTGEPLPIVARSEPTCATDDRGADVLDAIRSEDRRYPPIAPDRRFLGFATPHHVAMHFDLPDPPAGARWVLCANGWVEYGYSRDVFAASQAGLEPHAPSLEIRDAAGEWQMAMPEIGYPAGLSKFMTVDVTELVARGARDFRLGTNLEIHWDQIFLGRVGEPGAITQRSLPIAAAELRFKGYPREYSPDGRQPLRYDYGLIDPTLGFRAMAGSYTRFGDVRHLLAATDDRFVIMGRGEEIALRIDAATLPPPANGMARTFLLRADGYCKDMDLYTACPDTVEPLPFHGMSAYPYPATEHYPSSMEHRLYRMQDNTRRILGD